MNVNKEFTCPDTEGLNGQCILCGEGLDGHDLDFKCFSKNTKIDGKESKELSELIAKAEGRS